MPKPADVPSFVKALHASYETRTGYSIRYNDHRERQWWEWCEYCDWEWSDADLARVIHYLRAKINTGDRKDGALKFDNLIGNPPGFEEDLNLAREAAKGTPMFQKKPAPAKPAASGLVNAQGEEVLTGSSYLASLLSKPPPPPGNSSEG